MIAVYPYRKQPGDIELKYSMRSLRHKRDISGVLVVGDKPDDWYTGFHIESHNRDSALENVRRHLVLALTETSDESFLLMNDDFFINRWFEEEGKVASGSSMVDLLFAANGEFRDAIRRTMKVTGAKSASCELHRPIEMKTEVLREALRIGHEDTLLVRPVYGWLLEPHLIHRETVDHYVFSEETLDKWQDDLWFSTGVRFGSTDIFKRRIQDLYPGPSRWER